MKPKILTTIQTYSGPFFVADLFAGVTVALVAIPLSLAIAIASGADPAAGAFIVVVFGVIVAHGYDGLVLATFMAGIILIVAGLMRAGNLISFVPEAVVNGFTIGIAIIIAASQLNDLFGLTTSGLPAEFFSKLEVLWAARGTVNWASVGIGAVTMVLIVGLRRVAPKFPGLIVAVGLTSAVVYLFHLPVDTIGSRFGALPSQLPMPKLPELSLDRVTELLPSAFVIAFLAGVESLLSAMVADRMTGGQYRRNAEVMAQGAANMGSALFGGLPATGAIARTATNVRAGGKTPVAGIVHAFTILMAVLFAAPLAGYLAMPALAGLLMLTAWNMSEPHKWRAYMSDEKANVALLLITLVLTVVADLTIAIGVGVSLGLAIRLRRRHVGPADWSEPER